MLEFGKMIVGKRLSTLVVIDILICFCDVDTGDI